MHLYTDTALYALWTCKHFATAESSPHHNQYHHDRQNGTWQKRVCSTENHEIHHFVFILVFDLATSYRNAHHANHSIQGKGTNGHIMYRYVYTKTDILHNIFPTIYSRVTAHLRVLFLGSFHFSFRCFVHYDETDWASRLFTWHDFHLSCWALQTFKIY